MQFKKYTVSSSDNGYHSTIYINENEREILKNLLKGKLNDSYVKAYFTNNPNYHPAVHILTNVFKIPDRYYNFPSQFEFVIWANMKQLNNENVIFQVVGKGGGGIKKGKVYLQKLISFDLSNYNFS